MNKVIKVAFVCLGNICRSPMAELVFSDMISRRGISDMFEVSSYGTSDEESGNHIYPPAKRELAAHGITGDHIARKITPHDIAYNDYILVMDERNMCDVIRISGKSPGELNGKLFKLCDFTARPRSVADPWYTRDFSKAYEDIVEGCEGFIRALDAKKMRN